MILNSPYTLNVSKNFSAKELSKHTWLVVLNASRIPPHVGVLIEGNYNSLTIKGRELDVNIDVLIKMIRQKKLKRYLFN